MIIPNGTISIKEKRAGGIDPKTGHPLPALEERWSDPIPCQYVVNRYDAMKRDASGFLTDASFQILIEEIPFRAEQLRLVDEFGRLIGEFSVKFIEVLRGVCEIKIWV